MRLARRTRCPSTNALIILLALVLAFVLLIRRHSIKLHNGEEDPTVEQVEFGYLNNIQFLESMKKMFSVSEQEETTLPKTPPAMLKNEIFTITLPPKNNHTNSKYLSAIRHDDHDTADVVNYYHVEFSNVTWNKVTLSSLSSGPRSQAPKQPETNTENDLISRTIKVKEKCYRLSLLGKVNFSVRDIMTNRDRRLAYCFIPKCGCTFWKRVIRFLNRDYRGRNVSSPFEIRRLETHATSYANPNTFVPFRVFREISSYYNSFMFVREPYARLWSAYVDKFYLPDFWSNFEKQIQWNRHPSNSRRCVSDVSFQEFVSLSLETQEPHWDPMYKMCDPCTYKPTLVGRVETFAADSQYILEKANLSWIMDGYDHAMHVQEELVTLINYNFELVVVKPYIARCISKVGLFRRLWKTFQINGYLPADAFPPPLSKATRVAEFIQMVLEQYRRRPNTPDVWRKQRKEFMIAAYKTISTATLHDLRMKYARDFLLFNYDPHPSEIFGNRK